MKNLNFLCLFVCFLSHVTIQAQVQANDPDPIIICEEVSDGFAIFDLTIRNTQIINPSEGFEISYYEIQSDANNKINPIPDPQNYQNIIPYLQTVYVRVEDITNGDYAVVALDLIVGEYPEINENVSELYAYELINAETGIGLFDLTTKISEIIGNQTGLTIKFYEALEDAENDISYIEEPTAYQNNNNPAVAYTRVENSSGCFAIASFFLIPELNLSTTENHLQTISIYPNPTNNNITINNINKKSLLTLYSIEGKLLFSKSLAETTAEETVDLSNFESGMYILVLTSSSTKSFKKVIKR